jgi:type II secretory pathway component PulM
MSPRAKKALAYGAAMLALVAVFVLYTRPQMMVALGDMIWACFQ